MQILVVGAGAVGSLFAARLKDAGHEVAVVGRPAHVAAIRRDGLVVEGVRPTIVQLEAETTVPHPLRADAVLLATKTFDLRAAAGSVAEASGRSLPVLAPQNGIGVAELAVDGLRDGGWPHPDSSVARAVHTVPATWLGPGKVRQAGEGEILLPIAHGPAAGALGIWRGLLDGLGYPVHTTDRFGREVWRKAVLNAAVNPVTALHGVANGRLLEPPYRDRAIVLLTEARAAAAAEGEEFPAAELEDLLFRTVRATALNRSSMLQDLDRGRPTEIEAISGAILAIGRRHGLDLPATANAVAGVRARAARGAAPPARNGL